jgi:hypothetical protein
MKIYFVLIALLLISKPYVLNKDFAQTLPVVADAVQHSEPCGQKSIQKNVFPSCKSTSSCSNIVQFIIHYDLLSQLSQILIFIYLIALCKGFKLPIYKPPQMFI